MRIHIWQNVQDGNCAGDGLLIVIAPDLSRARAIATISSREKNIPKEGIDDICVRNPTFDFGLQETTLVPEVIFHHGPC